MKSQYLSQRGFGAKKAGEILKRADNNFKKLGKGR